MQDNKVFKESTNCFGMALEVLVIHYYEATGRELCATIKQLNHNGIYAYCVKDAINKLRENEYDMIIMTPIIGNELVDTKALRQVDKNIPLYLLHFFVPEHQDKLKEVGITEFIDKRSEDLYRKIEVILQSTPKKPNEGHQKHLNI